MKEEFEIFEGELLGYNGKNKNIRIPDGVKSISFRAFYGSDVCSVEIPQSVEFIGVQAFLCCRNLKFIVIPKSIKGMDDSVFSDCDSLTDIFFEAERGTEFGYDWDCDCQAALHYADEWEYSDGVPKAKA